MDISGRKRFYEHEKEKREAQLRDQVLQGKSFAEDIGFAKTLVGRVENRLRMSAEDILGTKDLKEIEKQVVKLAEFSNEWMPEERDYDNGFEL